MTAYYNEIDPKAAAWLHELIKGGHIAAGDVDETDIRDVDPARLGRYTQCHFFAGIGGWSHALRLAGWPDDRPVWTGSCPCQPFSAAGRRDGVADERHLWPHWHHLISVCRPSVVFGEQVASKDGLGWLDLVCADMEGSGYAVGAADLCAAGVGAPHIRQRLWFVGLADADGEDQRRRGIQRSRQSDCAGDGSTRERSAGLRSDGGLADADGGHTGAEGKQRQRLDRLQSSNGSAGVGPNAQAGSGKAAHGMADADDARSQGHGRSVWQHVPSGRATEGRHGAEGGDDGRLAVSASARQLQRGICDGRELQRSPFPTQSEGSSQAGSFVRLDEDVDMAGWPAARPTDGHWRDADWLFCRDDRWRPVEPGTFPLAHGVSARVGRLRGYGNAIVPQVAATFIGSVM